MRLKDIVVGEDYAVGTERGYVSIRRATALEVGIRRRVFSGERHDMSGHTSARADGVRVRFASGREDIVDAREVLRSWAEQEPINRARDDAKDAEGRRKETAEAQVEVARAALADIGIHSARDGERLTLRAVDAANLAAHIRGQRP